MQGSYEKGGIQGSYPPPPPAQPVAKGARGWIIAWAAMAVLFLGASAAFGTQVHAKGQVQDKLRAANTQVALVNQQIGVVDARLSDLNSQVSTAQSNAAQSETARHTCFLAAQVLYHAYYDTLTAVGHLSAAGITAAGNRAFAQKATVRACLRSEGVNGF